MLIAYLDEFGHVGPYWGSDHPKYSHSPVFGYAGFVLPDGYLRQFSKCVHVAKSSYFVNEISDAEDPHSWEKKGAELLTRGAYEKYGSETTRLLVQLAWGLRRNHGRFFFYGELKPRKESPKDRQRIRERSSSALIGAVHRIARFAASQEKNVYIFLDQVDDANRKHAIDVISAQMFAQGQEHMVRLVEIPTQVESSRYAAMQFADWYCALLSRVVKEKLTSNSDFAWAPALLGSVRGACSFVKESRIWNPQAQRAIKSSLLVEGAGRIDLENLDSYEGVGITQRLGDRPAFADIAARIHAASNSVG